jgi:uncharacterized membrane protein YfcA
LTSHAAIYLFLAGVLGGALNAVAGGGSFISFPALLFTGVPPIPANATSSFALWLGISASGGAYRSRMNIARRLMIPLIVAGIVGGLAGALLLIHTPASTFLRVIPWLMLGATLLFAFGRHLAQHFSSAMSSEATNAAIAWAVALELVVALYGGYFGGGIGIVNLAMLAMLGMTDIHAMNALKVVLSAVINGAAVVMFIAARTIFWPQAIATAAGAIVGGYFGARYAQKLSPSLVRGVVIAVGAGMSIYFFIRAY